MTRGFLRFLRRNTIALLALFLALGGTTYAASSALIAGNSVASPQVVNGSLQTKDLSAKARKALKGNRGLRGLAGAQGAKGVTGAQGVQGVQGVQGAAGTALAYVHVADDGTLDVANSKGVTAGQVARTSLGNYCFSGLSFTPHAVIASTDGFGPSDNFVASPTIINCGGAPGVRVRMTAGSTAALTDHAFYVFFE